MASVARMPSRCPRDKGGTGHADGATWRGFSWCMEHRLVQQAGAQAGAAGWCMELATRRVQGDRPPGITRGLQAYHPWDLVALPRCMGLGGVTIGPPVVWGLVALPYPPPVAWGSVAVLVRGGCLSCNRRVSGRGVAGAPGADVGPVAGAPGADVGPVHGRGLQERHQRRHAGTRPSPSDTAHGPMIGIGA